jgi:hypothetical protein
MYQNWQKFHEVIMKKSKSVKIGTIKIFLLLGLLAAGGICVIAYLRRGNGIPFISRPQIYSIGLYSGPSIFELSPYTDVANPIMSAEKISDVSADFVADPFVIEHDGTWYLFFEVLRRDKYEGDIGLATSMDGLKWEYAGIVLDEQFHLSYPNVFKWRDEFYMIPESNRAKSIRLYKAESFPLKWTFQHSLVTGRFVDPTIFYYDNRWWMFASEISSATLHLFHSNELEGPWEEHVKSPVVQNDANIGRCAGRILEYEGKLLRFAQDCDPIYGQGVRVFEITELSVENYSEKEINDNLLSCESGNGWNKDGMHHICFMKTGDMWLACVDGWRWKLRFGLEY